MADRPKEAGILDHTWKDGVWCPRCRQMACEHALEDWSWLKQKYCRNCEHTWIPRVQRPKVCPSCHTHAWDREPRKAGRKPRGGD